LEARLATVHPKNSVSCIQYLRSLLRRVEMHCSRDQTDRIRFLRQSITLTGFGTDTFEAGIQSLHAVRAFFDRHLPEDKLDEITIIDNCEDHFGIHFTNRYFTTQRESQAERSVEFPTEVDPHGILAGLANEQFMHTEQNEVKYYNRSVDKGGMIKYVHLAIR
jgi:hypothetical protein